MSGQGYQSRPPQRRAAGTVEYVLTYKRVKRINLRVHPDGTVAASAPWRVPAETVDRFVADSADWIKRARARVMVSPAAMQDLHSDAECLAAFSPVLDRLYPLVAGSVPAKPALKVRFMKSRWGVCHVQKGCITLNKQLLDKPPETLEYVVLHELVHLIHPDHQAGFHAEMARLMPDYRQRRALLRQTDKTTVDGSF